MDLLYSHYSNPCEFMNHYFDQGRFGEFVSKVIDKETKHRQEEAEKEEENRLWMIYVHSNPKQSFNDWKRSVVGNRKSPGTSKSTKDVSLSDDDILKIIDRFF